MYLDELNRQREIYQTEGNILKEIKILREILAETEKQYGIESDEYIKALNELGGTLKYVGYYDEAERNLKKSLEIIKKKYGDNNLAYATSLLNLTEVYRFAQKFIRIIQLIIVFLMQGYAIILVYIIKILGI